MFATGAILTLDLFDYDLYLLFILDDDNDNDDGYYDDEAGRCTNQSYVPRLQIDTPRTLWK